MLEDLSELAENEDFKRYQYLVSAESELDDIDLYTYMGEHLSQMSGRPFSRQDRKKMKVGMFEVLFSRNAYAGKSGVKKYFWKEFPSIGKLFHLIKEGDHTRLARLLQSVESHIMLKVVTRKIAKLNPSIPLFTIHDSITTTERYADLVKSVMERELTRIVGVRPKLKTEVWDVKEMDWDKYLNPLLEVA